MTGLDNINDYYDPSLKMARLKELGITSIAESGDNVFQISILAFSFIKVGLDDKDRLFALFDRKQV